MQKVEKTLKLTVRQLYPICSITVRLKGRANKTCHLIPIYDICVKERSINKDNINIFVRYTFKTTLRYQSITVQAID